MQGWANVRNLSCSVGMGR